VQRTQWSRFQELRVRFADPTVQPDNVTAENWHDTTFVSLGAECHPGDGWAYRLGLAKDKAPVDDAFRTPRIPDADRTWIAAGLSHQFARQFGVDLAYTHVFAKDSTVNLQGGTDPSSSNFIKGNLSGTYKNSIDIVALQARWSF
jgi:long-chain fatty acid transport protein